MKRKNRWIGLIILACGLLPASTCDAVWQTISFAFGIVDVWV